MSDLRITAINISGSEIKHKDISVEKYEPPAQSATKVGRTYVGKDRMVFAPHFEKMFFDNEICPEPKIDKRLKYDFLSSPHGNNYTLKQRFRKHKESIGGYRTQYNKRTLYVTQKPVLLLSFAYSPEGRIISRGNTFYDYLSFHQCYEKCLEYKVADPRFVAYNKIVAIRNAINNGDTEWADWTAPTDQEFKTLCSLLGVQELFNCISFPHGYKLGD